MLRFILIPLALGTISATPLLSDLTPQVFPVMGGSGGSSFSRSCGSGKVLTGLYGREGLVVDAIGVLCRPVNANGTLGSESAIGSLAGGSGGTSASESCPTGTVAVSLNFRAGSYVNYAYLLCKRWDPATRKFTGSIVNSAPGLGYAAGGTYYKQECSQPAQPINGFRGRGASVIDALGAICNEP